MKPKVGQRIIATVRAPGAGTDDDQVVNGMVIRIDKVKDATLIIVAEDDPDEKRTMSASWAFDLSVFRKAKLVDGVIHIEAEGA